MRRPGPCDDGEFAGGTDGRNRNGKPAVAIAEAEWVAGSIVLFLRCESGILNASSAEQVSVLLTETVVAPTSAALFEVASGANPKQLHESSGGRVLFR